MSTWRLRLFRLLSGISLGASVLASATAASEGVQVFQQNCAVCHQSDAQGMVGLAPPLKSGQWAKFATDRTYIPSVPLSGMNGNLQLENTTLMGVMPTQNRLSDDDIAAVINYLFITVNGQISWEPLQASDIAALRQKLPSVSHLRALRKQIVGQ